MPSLQKSPGYSLENMLLAPVHPLAKGSQSCTLLLSFCGVCLHEALSRDASATTPGDEIQDPVLSSRVIQQRVLSNRAESGTKRRGYPETCTPPLCPPLGVAPKPELAVLLY